MNVETFEIDNWEKSCTGLILAENKDWLLVKNIPGDYYLDGYSVYKKEFVVKRVNGSEERLIEKVFTLKGITPVIPKDFQFTDTIGYLKWCEQKFGIFEIQDDDEEALSYGKINRILGNKLTIDFITSKGRIIDEYDYYFEIDQIRVITFGSDYFEAIRLLYFDKYNIIPTP